MPFSGLEAQQVAGFLRALADELEGKEAGGLQRYGIDLHAFTGGREARQGIGNWMTFYNHQRPHAAHGGRTPIDV